MDFFKNNIVAGVGLAFTATVLAPILLPAMGRIGRPLAKSLVRGGMMMYEKGREAVAVAGESVEDLMAEIRAEHRQAAAPSPAPAPAEPAEATPRAAGPHPAGPYSGGNGAGAAGPAQGANGAGMASDI